MSKKGSRYLIIIASLLAMGTGAYFIFRKKGDNTNTDGSNLPSDGSNQTSAGNNVDSSVVGKKAYASKNDVWVRSSTYVGDSVFQGSNNRVGKLAKNEEAGTISVIKTGSDGNTWFMVSRNSSYDCPFTDCGFTFGGKSDGYVSANDVYIK